MNTSQGLRAQLTIELAEEAGWCPVARPDPGESRALLPRRIPLDRRVRIVATDGWNTAMEEADAEDRR